VISEKSHQWLMLLAIACLGLFNTPAAFSQAGQQEPFLLRVVCLLL
jgi:hypothetical protein